jgi:HD-GYP domain-containing protein (c-di-GMP phosphodiesterase class II)
MRFSTTDGSRSRVTGAETTTGHELRQALEVRYMDLSRHGDRVAHYCEMTARRLGMSAAEAGRVAIAGALHDVGKTEVDEAILKQTGTPTPQQWEQIRHHPAFGYVKLRAAGLDDVARWVLCHHERMDGLGYPRGLTGDEIPIAARILSVVDAYDAMVSDRVYRAARPAHEAVAELRACAGTQFDPVVVEAFVTALRPEWIRAARVPGIRRALQPLRRKRFKPA